MAHAIINGETVELTDAEFAEFEAQQASAVPLNAVIDAQILALEALQTPRRIREAALTEAGRARLADVDAQIAALRAQRV
jgi:hypothetical protein